MYFLLVAIESIYLVTRIKCTKYDIMLTYRVMKNIIQTQFAYIFSIQLIL